MSTLGSKLRALGQDALAYEAEKLVSQLEQEKSTSAYWYREAKRSLVVSDSPKMLRETLCVAQARVGNSPLDESRKREHVDRLSRLIAECDRHRPLGRAGVHGDLHTDTCGCERP